MRGNEEEKERERTRGREREDGKEGKAKRFAAFEDNENRYGCDSVTCRVIISEGHYKPHGYHCRANVPAFNHKLSL